nr:hypothetical protein [Tanacetum cinerariifolium]
MPNEHPFVAGVVVRGRVAAAGSKVWCRDGEEVWCYCRPRMATKGVVAATVVTAGVVVAAGWRGDGAAREGEWRGGSDRSGDRESFWVRRKSFPAAAAAAWWPAAGGGWPVGVGEK